MATSSEHETDTVARLDPTPAACGAKAGDVEPHVELLASLLSDSRAVVETLLWEPLLPVGQLVQQIQDYVPAIRAAGMSADQKLAQALVEGLEALMAELGTAPDAATHRLAQVAVRYFVLDDDGDDDLATPFGLDDDVEVFNAVVHRLGRDHLAITSL